MAAEPPALRLRPPGSTGDSPPLPRLLGGCVPLSHQVAGHMYGKDKVGECGLGFPSPVFAVLCPGSPRPRLCPAPAVPGLRCPQPRWCCGLSRHHLYSHWSPLSPPWQSQASLSQLSPALLSPPWRSLASHPGHSCLRLLCSLPGSPRPQVSPPVWSHRLLLSRVSPVPRVGSPEPPGVATGS